MSDGEVAAFLAGRRVMNVATIGHDGRPHLVAMWYGFLGSAPAFATYASSQKVVNLRRDPRLTALVEDGDRYEDLRGVELVATGTIIEDPDVVGDVGESVYERYSAVDAGPLDEQTRPLVRAAMAKRCVVRVDIERTVSWDHTKLGAPS